MRIFYNIAGRDMQPADFDSESVDEEHRQVIKRISATLADKVGDLKCPTHGEEATAFVSGLSYDKLGLEMKGCCDEFVRTVSRKLHPSERH